jgi:hypothetical protein
VAVSTANAAGVDVDTRHWIGGLSGIGREGGTWSFDFYADVKNTVYAPEGWRSDG